MDDNYFDDDFGRKPGAHRFDEASSFDEAHHLINNTSPEVHAQHEAAADAYINNDTAREVLGNDRSSAVLVDDPEAQQRIADAAARDAASGSDSAAQQVLKQATQQELGQVTGLGTNDGAIRGVEDLTNQSTGKMAGEATSLADAMKQQGAEKPTSLESTLAAIRLNQERQQRFVITGDPSIQRAFYERLAQRGQLHYQGGQPIISLSHAKALKTLNEVARDTGKLMGEDVTVKHALSMKLDREGGSFMQNLSAGIKNNLLGKRHELDVIVVGNSATVDAKMKELGGFVESMERNGHIKEGSASVKDQALVVPETGPVKLEATTEMFHVLNAVKIKVEQFNAERADKLGALRDMREAKDFKSLDEAKDKASGAPEVTAKETIKPHTAKLAASIDKAFSDPNLLHTNKGNGQIEAIALLSQARGWKDPTERELQALPEGARQKTIVQLTALVRKVDDNDFKSDYRSTLESHSAGTSTIRQKVEAYVAMEAARDPDFAKKSEVLLKNMVDTKVLTEEQSTKISEHIAGVVEKVNAAKSSHATDGAAPAADAKASEASTAGPTKQAADAPVDTTAASATVTTGESTAATSEQQKGVTTATTESTTTAQATTAGGDSKEASATATASSQDVTRDTTTVSQSHTAGEQRASTESSGSAEAKSATVEAPVSSATQATAGEKTSTTAETQSGTHTASGDSSLVAPAAASTKAGADITTGETKQLSEGAVRSGAESKSDATAATGQAASDTQNKADTHAQSSANNETQSVRTQPPGEAVSTSDTKQHTSGATRTAESQTQGGGYDTASSQSAQSGSSASATKAGATEQQGSSSGNATSRTSSLSVEVNRLADGGPDKMTANKAYTLVAQLDAIRTKPLSSLDGGTGAEPTKTLSRVDNMLKDMESGRFGSELRALAKDLADPVKSWKEQDAMRTGAAVAGTTTYTEQGTVMKAAGEKVRVESGDRTASAVDSATTAAAQSAKEQAAMRGWETESAGARLSAMMANPAGSFTNRDKSWNEQNIQKAAQEVLRMDPEATAQLSPAQRTKAVVNAAWVADNARTGKLPGFDSPEGKELVGKLTERAAALIEKLDGVKSIPADVQKSLEKADRMVSAKEQLEKSSSASNQVTRQPAATREISSAAANALSKDLVHAVSRQADVGEAQAKYLLKNVSNLTPDAMKAMTPEHQAQTATAMKQLTEQVRGGSIGEFATLPNSVQKSVLATEHAATQLSEAVGSKTGSRTQSGGVSEAAGTRDASERTHSASSKSSGGSTGHTASDSASTTATATKSGGRSIDR